MPLLPVAPGGCTDLFQKGQSNPEALSPCLILLHQLRYMSTLWMVREYKYLYLCGRVSLRVIVLKMFVCHFGRAKTCPCYALQNPMFITELTQVNYFALRELLM